jgi:hypothetical protein
MSIWIYRKNREGKKEIYSMSIPFGPLLILLGFLLAIIIPRLMKPSQYLKESSFIVAVGFMLVLISKISLFRKGIWNSWGPKLMDKPYRILYKCGYVLVGIGIISCLFL